MGASSSRNNDFNEKEVSNQVDQYSDSKVEEVFIEFGTKGDFHKGASTPSTDVAHAELGLHKIVVCGATWTLLGDFNVALNMEDQHSGSSSMDSPMCDFKDCVKDIKVFDINSFGLHFTWNQKPKGSGGILKKLNRIIGNTDFVDLFPGAYAIFLPYRILDHSPSVIQKMKSLKKPCRKLLHDQGYLHDRVNRLRKELDELDEERFLKQKAKIEWLDVGDSNSTYFHKTIKSRNQRSRIDAIINGENMEVTGDAVLNIFVSHYESFLGTDMVCELLDSEGLFDKQVSDSSNEKMTRPITDAEIKREMFGIGNDKALGPDGFTSVLFKKSWDIVGQDILTNRIIGGIKEVVSENQSVFVPGRHISDNILITQELMHNYHLNRGPPRCAFKVDIQKSYDTVDWRFLGHILKCFGFHPVMIQWIMACVTSTPFSISINGDIHGFFKGKRGLCQGDVASAMVIMESLNEFQHVSGLIPSIPKSTAFFCNVVNHVKVGILSIMPFSKGELSVKYLGVPLISSLISAMQVYWASVLVIPKGITSDIQQLTRGLLWCNRDYKRGKAKVAWESICLPKSEGGLGLRSLEVFNLALMTTHIWNIVTHKEYLWVCWIHMYKLRGRSLWEVQPKSNMSWGWRKILQFCKQVRPFIWAVMGNGHKTSLWHDHWCTQSPLSRHLSPRDIARDGYNLRTCVSDLVVHGGWNWPSTWLAKAHILVSIPALVLDYTRQDCMKWRDTNGNFFEFLVRCAWEALRPSGTYSSQVWRYVRTFTGMDSANPTLADIMLYCQPLSNKRTVKRVVGKLLFAAASYYVWLERNNRLFKSIRRQPKELCDLIIVTIRLKLLTFKFKNTVKVERLLSL
ncbi:putative RNA-directed DNA polymerase, eukaryota, reverse transcriptase zinc-binding domain protein [Tanacetum coccineum]